MNIRSLLLAILISVTFGATADDTGVHTLVKLTSNNQAITYRSKLPQHVISDEQVKLTFPSRQSLTDENMKNMLNKPFLVQITATKSVVIVFSEGRVLPSQNVVFRGRTIGTTLLNTTLTLGKQNYFLTVNDFETNEVIRIAGQTQQGGGNAKRMNTHIMKQQQKLH